jgi:hypothetical protein
VRNHQVGDVAGVGADEMQVDARILPVKNSEMFGNHVGRDRGAGANAERSAVEIAERHQLVFGRSFGRKHGFRVPGEGLALAGRPHAFGGAVEQPAADLQFEVPHALGDGGLTDVQDVRRPRKAASTHDGREQTQQMEVQRHNFPLSGKIENILSISGLSAHETFCSGDILCRKTTIAPHRRSLRPRCSTT